MAPSLLSNLTPTPTFHPFRNLPTEIRTQIWLASLTSHIVRWIRTEDDASNNHTNTSLSTLPTPQIVRWTRTDEEASNNSNSTNLFTASTRNIPLLLVSHEAREAVFFNAIFLPSQQNKNSIWFNPSIDYLHLDPAWTSLTSHGSSKDPLDSLPLDLKLVKKIMVHPNYTDDRLRPGILLERMPNLETILIVADEKSIGAQSKFMLGSVYDLQKYYEDVKRKRGADLNQMQMQTPYIAIGCLGWVGADRWKLRHGGQDGRMLVAVFDSHAQMKEHMNLVREEEVRFLKERFEGRKLGLTLRFRPGKSMEQVSDAVASTVDDPPAFSGSAEQQVVLPGEDELPDYTEAVAGDSNGHSQENDNSGVST